MLSYHMVEN